MKRKTKTRIARVKVKNRTKYLSVYKNPLNIVGTNYVDKRIGTLQRTSYKAFAKA